MRETILLDVLDAAERSDYCGYGKFDALNSPFLNTAASHHKWLRLLFTQIVARSPVHIRPLLGVKKSRNPKGIALFARAYLLLFERTSDLRYLRKAEGLLDWLLEHSSPNQRNLCWGYDFVWQNTIFLQDKNQPNAVVSTFVGEALIHVFRVTGNDKYLKAAESVARFLSKDLPVPHDTGDERAIAYVMGPVDAVVLNIQVLAGAFLAKLWKETQQKDLLDLATRHLQYTASRATNVAAWFYTDPKHKSPITHDNYHTGGILDGFIEYFEETGNDGFLELYWKGLDFYQKHLFEADGAPRWMYNKRYPHDVHGAAQGIITFKKASVQRPEYLEFAEKIYHWAIQHLYRPQSCDFAYRQGRFVRWNFSLMRWCNAWMARALAELN